MRAVLIYFMIFAAATIMLVIGCERKVVYENGDFTDANNCFICHGDNDALLLAAKGEWENSVHASGNNVDYTNRGGTDCTRCHDHQGFLEYLATGESGVLLIMLAQSTVLHAMLPIQPEHLSCE